MTPDISQIFTNVDPWNLAIFIIMIATYSIVTGVINRPRTKERYQNARNNWKYKPYRNINHARNERQNYEYEIENESESNLEYTDTQHDKNKPHHLKYTGEVIANIEKYAFEIDDGIGESSAVNHYFHLKKHTPWMNDNEKWKQIKTLWNIKRLNTNEFNEFIKWVFEKDGWTLKVMDGMNDGGIDIQGYKKEGEERHEIYIQCKNWKKWAVGENALSEFAGKPKIADGLKQGKRIVFVTSSYFSQRGKDVGNYHKIEMVDHISLISEYEEYKKSGSIQIEEDLLQ